LATWVGLPAKNIFRSPAQEFDPIRDLYIHATSVSLPVWFWFFWGGVLGHRTLSQCKRFRLLFLPRGDWAALGFFIFSSTSVILGHISFGLSYILFSYGVQPGFPLLSSALPRKLPSFSHLRVTQVESDFLKCRPQDRFPLFVVLATDMLPFVPSTLLRGPLFFWKLPLLSPCFWKPSDPPPPHPKHQHTPTPKPPQTPQPRSQTLYR